MEINSTYKFNDENYQKLKFIKEFGTKYKNILTEYTFQIYEYSISPNPTNPIITNIISDLNKEYYYRIESIGLFLYTNFHIMYTSLKNKVEIIPISKPENAEYSIGYKMVIS